MRLLALGGLLLWFGSAGCKRAAGPELEHVTPDPALAAEAAEPGAILDAFADDPQPGRRAQAVRWRVRAGGPGRPDDPSAWVQRAEVEGLAWRAAEAEAELLAIATRDDVDPWVRALAALVRPGPAMGAALADYRDESLAWRRIPLALGAWVGGDDDAKGVLVRDLRSGTLDWNVELMLAIGDHGDEDVLSALVMAQAAAEPELELAIAAARLLLGDDGGAAAFRRVIDGSDVEARLEALDLLVDVPGEVASALVERAGARGPGIVTWYAELAEIERDGTRPGRLDKAMDEDNPEVRELAVRFAAPGVLGLPWRPRPEIDDKRREIGRAVVETGYADPDPRVRRQALQSAAALGLPAEGPAAALVLDPHPQVRIAAAGLRSL